MNEARHPVVVPPEDTTKVSHFVLLHWFIESIMVKHMVYEPKESGVETFGPKNVWVGPLVEVKVHKYMVPGPTPVDVELKLPVNPVGNPCTFLIKFATHPVVVF